MRLITHGFKAVVCTVVAALAFTVVPASAETPADLQNQVNQIMHAKKGSAAKVPVDVQAFSKTAKNLFPLQTHQIHQIRRLYNDAQRAASFSGDVPPKPVASSLVVNLSPGSTPPVIRLASGFISSLVFLDSTGAPWPIKAIDVGNPQAFNVIWHQSTPAEEKSGEGLSNTLLIQPITMYRQGNLAVILKGLNTPVMLTLLPGQQVIDYRVDVHVPRLGPQARPSVSGLPPQSSPLLLDVLNNLTPQGSKRLHVDGGQADAFLLGDVMFVRTPMTLISPAWTGVMNSSDQTMHAYALAPTSTLLVTRHGRVTKLHIKGL